MPQIVKPDPTEENMSLATLAMVQQGITLEDAERTFRRMYVIKLLAVERGNQCRAAERGKIHRNTLGRMIEDLKIDVNQIRELTRKHPPASAQKANGAGICGLKN